MIKIVPVITFPPSVSCVPLWLSTTTFRISMDQGLATLVSVVKFTLLASEDLESSDDLSG